MKDRIRLLMEDQHLTQQSFAQLLGISSASLSSIFNDRTKPTLNIVDAIHKKFPQVNPVWILFGTPPMYLQDAATQQADGEGSEANGQGQPGMESLALDFGDENGSLSTGAAPQNSSSQMTQGSLFDQPQSQGVKQTLKNAAQDNVKYIDKPQRKITEIRIFYDDQTWETFVPKK